MKPPVYVPRTIDTNFPGDRDCGNETGQVRERKSRGASGSGRENRDAERVGNGNVAQASEEITLTLGLRWSSGTSVQ